MRHLSLRQLQVVRAVADLGSMARAAEALHMTGPAVTQQVQQLERTLCARVFDRLGRRLRLTVVGERALAPASDVQARLGLLYAELDALRKRDHGTLHLGILGTGTHILPPLLAEFRQRAPGIAVQMAVLPREELVLHVLDGEVDHALMGRGAVPDADAAGASGSPLLLEPFADNPHVIIAWPAVVYRTLQAQAPADQLALPGASVDPVQTLRINTTEIETTITQAVKAVGPAVVTVVGTVPGQQTFFGQSPDQDVSGSGFFVSDQGYIITNAHVVQNTKAVSFILSDGSEQEAVVVGADKYNDIAVLKAGGPVPAVAALGDSDVLQPGESVIAIGSPLGDFKNTVTVGVVSATGRSIDTGEGYQVEGLVQTDAAINQVSRTIS